MRVDSPRGGGKTESVELAKRCRAALEVIYGCAYAGRGAEAAYGRALRCVTGMLAVLSAAEQIDDHQPAAIALRRAARVLNTAAVEALPGSSSRYYRAISKLRRSTGFGIFRGGLHSVSDEALHLAAQALLSPSPEAPIETLFYQTMPFSWIGQAYQGMLALRPGTDGALQTSRDRRKAAGVYYTPGCLVTYVVRSALDAVVAGLPGPIDGSPMAESICRVAVLDPSVGGGEFLAESVILLSRQAGIGSQEMRARVAANCVYGIDIDPISVEVSRFRVWAASGFADGISEPINDHIVLGDTHTSLESEGAFHGWPESFDAVLGNPPYIASKNGLKLAVGAGQSDSYLLFLSAILDHGLVKPNGILSMVLPDPLLVRSNAAEFRRKIASDWTIISLLHIAGSFREAGVANIVPVLRYAKSNSPAFCASRIERIGDQRAFALRPIETAKALCGEVRLAGVLAQPKCELLYLLENGPFGEVMQRIHGPEVALTNYEPPFAPLESLNIGSIYRGEEIGKSAIGDTRDGWPILLGGQSISPYDITWEGHRIAESQIRKKRERYARTKILIQKSAPRIVAALDRAGVGRLGFVFPQSVYAIELRHGGMDECYLLCLLNSAALNEYIWRTVTAYKFVQPQLEIEDIRRLPIRRVDFTTDPDLRQSLAARGLETFESEQSTAAGRTHFAALDNFIAHCLAKDAEHSDVVHDILSHIGKEIVDMIAMGRKSPETETMRRLEAARAAAEVIVWRLYSSAPAQMGLPW